MSKQFTQRKSSDRHAGNDTAAAGLEVRESAVGWPDYELLDAGDGKKLERWGEVVTIRPEIQAHFKPGWSWSDWQAGADWEFEELSSTQGTWKRLQPQASEHWQISYQQLRFGLKLTKFKHVGLFPEQQANWRFIAEQVKPGDKVLNLFAYTGAASLVARANGAEVVHVDSVKQMLDWANDNQTRSGLSDIKWVLEDALKFARRELKRGNRYDGIIMDPPAWGLGAKGEKWKLENQLADLIETARGLMNPGAFLILNTYSPKVELADLANAAGPYFAKNQIEIKQLWMQSKTGKALFYGNLLRAMA
ncbi:MULTISPECIES: class I SAM-dependent methyltransferase [Methylomonas]|uniref:SAM-dependent methyltransferase n=2 Tax=Methylomonas TaxID=416 RepID=A0A126T6E4_9GAMM|nr:MULTISPECIES: class I SAM-dependent methyltransferase [Methylomonas]AMK77662.1 SAM-dependent methyltransferase [Methylomonas denitrificans]OAH96843.1 SAM-dependent methyltransferase [Methylomonas methanica]TCV86832.1 23S rRNA (cytosine1962-C5)-methyltransferase [Methylomonas methanica]